MFTGTISFIDHFFQTPSVATNTLRIFSCQNPAIDSPNHSEYPNWKVRHLLTWMNFIFTTIWLLGLCFSIDKMTMRFQVQHKDKRRITYKAEVDGFQADALCDDGFIYQVYMRNDPKTKKYLKQGLSPIHSRVMALFDAVKDSYHHCTMDHLYNSTTFFRAAYNRTRNIIFQGVTCKGMRGIPPSVLQVEQKSRKDQIKVRGNVKAALLEGDDACPNLVACSIYDTNPVHYLSMVCNKLKWVVMEKPCFNVETGMVETLRFLRMNIIHEYSNTMGGVDLAV